MALTDIAKQLKEAFEGFESIGIDQDIEKFRELYKQAEGIRIGEMNYIVINEPYVSDDQSDIGDLISPLFYNSINKNYAIIDSETSSTLIDEVYSRITYMQRICQNKSKPDSSEIERNLLNLFGDNPKKLDVILVDTDEGSSNANIFQCYMVKDTGVSAVSDVYSFMLRDGIIKAIPDNVIRRLNINGEVKLLKNKDEIKDSLPLIQEAIFERYNDLDKDIQRISVKSIFQILMSSVNIKLLYTDDYKHRSVFNTHYLVSEKGEFDILNSQIHMCNMCSQDVISVDDNRTYALHTNIDAIDEEMTKKTGKLVYAVGCERCLVQCPICGAWHFDYKRLSDKDNNNAIVFAPGRSFVRSLDGSSETNYCSCREGIEWIHDEKTSVFNAMTEQDECNVIPVEEIAFFNFVDEQLATYEEYSEFRDKELKNLEKRLSKFTGNSRGVEEQKAYYETIVKFKKSLANKFDIDENEIKISSSLKSKECDVCGGKYHSESITNTYETFRCDACKQLKEEASHMVTRKDGMIFMLTNVKKKSYLNKYVMTKLGTLKLINSKQIVIKETIAPEVSEQEGEDNGEE
ncbi:MAG: hypothetical protein J6V71_00315 [Clostridia bacterium]|nr:hypothetical protein [Clostridia bacterium]